jgi:hypothetical protein
MNARDTSPNPRGGFGGGTHRACRAKPPFEWLRPYGPRGRRSALVQVRRAIREGWLEGPGEATAALRAALVDALSAVWMWNKRGA